MEGTNRTQRLILHFYIPSQGKDVKTRLVAVKLTQSISEVNMNSALNMTLLLMKEQPVFHDSQALGFCNVTMIVFPTTLKCGIFIMYFSLSLEVKKRRQLHSDK